MPFDISSHLAAVERSVSSPERDGRPTRAVTVSCGFETTVEDLWDAVTNADRIPRWFLPISGDLKIGGRYQLEGNAGGVIMACEAPARLDVTWEFGGDVSWVEFGGDVSWVEVRLSIDEAGAARLALTHIASLSDEWDTYGPGATGVGWELGLLGLALYLAQPAEPRLEEEAFATSVEGRAFISGSSEGWAQAAVAFGTDPAAAAAAATRTTAFYTGEDPDSA